MTPRPCLFAVDPAGTGHVDAHRGAFEGCRRRVRGDIYVRLNGRAARGWEAGRLIGPSTNALIAALGLKGVIALEDG